MDFHEHLEMAGDPNNIPGIYNYCDGWCERCTFTSKCLNFKSRTKFEEEYERRQREEENKLFWDEVNNAIEEVKLMLGDEEDVEMKNDILSLEDINDADYDFDIEDRKKMHLEAAAQPISKASFRYLQKVREFFERREDLLQALKPEEGNFPILENEAFGDEPVRRKISIAVEVAFYYHLQISVKINRALVSSYDDLEEDDEFADYPKDSDGSAKVALLGMDQSITAWTTLYKFLQADRTEIHSMLTLLKQLRHATERVFPNARAFKRPGFDD